MSSEAIQGTLPAIMTRGIRGDLHCTLVFTTTRVIISVKGLLAQATASGAFGAAGAIGGAVGAAVAGSSKGPTMAQSPDEILGSNKRNIEISYSNIAKVETGRKLMTNRLYIHGPDEVYKFKFQVTTLERVEDTLRRMLPGSIPVHRLDKLD